MDQNFEKQLRLLLPDWWVLHGVKDDQLTALAVETGTVLPSEYVDFMRLVDGYTGKVGGKGYIDIMTLDEAIRTNYAHQVKETFPGLVLFGSDGAGEAFAFDTRSGGISVVQVAWVGMDWETAIPLGKSLLEFLIKLGELAR